VPPGRGRPSVNWDLQGRPDRRASARGPSGRRPRRTPSRLGITATLGACIIQRAWPGGAHEARRLPRRDGGGRSVTWALTAGRPDRGASPPGRRAVRGGGSILKQRRRAAYVRDPVRDDQSSSVLRTSTAGRRVTRHETSSPAIQGPREAQDESNAEVRRAAVARAPSTRWWVNTPPPTLGSCTNGTPPRGTSPPRR